MPKELTDADVFGDKELSDQDVFGTPTPAVTSKPSIASAFKGMVPKAGERDVFDKVLEYTPGVMLGSAAGVQNTPYGIIQTGTDIAGDFLNSIGQNDTAVGREVSDINKNATAAIKNNDSSLFSGLPGYKTSNKLSSGIPLVAIGAEVMPFTSVEALSPYIAQYAPSLQKILAGSMNIGMAEGQSSIATALSPEESSSTANRMGEAANSVPLAGAAQAAIGPAGKVLSLIQRGFSDKAGRLFGLISLPNSDVANTVNRNLGGTLSKEIGNNDSWTNIKQAASNGSPVTTAEASKNIGMLNAQEAAQNKNPLPFQTARINNNIRNTELWNEFTGKNDSTKLVQFAQSNTAAALAHLSSKEQELQDAISGDKTALMSSARSMINDSAAAALYHKYDVTKEDLSSLASGSTPTKPDFARDFYGLLTARINQVRDAKNIPFTQWAELAPHTTIPLNHSPELLAHLENNGGELNDTMLSAALNGSQAVPNIKAARNASVAHNKELGLPEGVAGTQPEMNLATAVKTSKQLSAEIQQASEKNVPGQVRIHNQVDTLRQMKDALDTDIQDAVSRSSNPDLRAAYENMNPAYKKYVGQALNVSDMGTDINTATRTLLEELPRHDVIPAAVLGERYFTGNPAQDDINMKNVNRLFSSEDPEEAEQLRPQLDKIHASITGHAIDDLKTYMGSEPSLDKLDKWKQNNSGTISNIPVLKAAVDDLSNKFQTSSFDANSRKSAIAALQSTVEALRANTNKDIFATIARNAIAPDGSLHTAVPAAIVGRALSSPADATEFDKLVKAVKGNASAIEGLKGSISDYLSAKILTDKSVSGQDIINSASFKSMLKNEHTPLWDKLTSSGLYSHEELAQLQQVKKNILAQYSPAEVAATPGKITTTNTARDLTGIAAGGHNWLTRIWEGAKDLKGGVVDRQINDLFVKALVDPKVAMQVNNIARNPSPENIKQFLAPLYGQQNSEQPSPPTGLVSVPYQAIQMLKKDHSAGDSQVIEEFNHHYKVPGGAEYILKYGYNGQ